MKTSICIETFFSNLSYEERIDKVAKFGFRAFEFWDWKTKNLKRVKREAERNNLIVALFSANRNSSLVDPSDRKSCVQEVAASIEAAHELNCSNLMLLTDALTEDGTVKKSYGHLSMKEKYVNVIETLRELEDLARKNNILLLLEPLNSKIDHVGYYLDSVELGFHIVSELASENVKLLYDIYHAQIMEGNLINTIRQNINSIGYFHVADVPGRHEPGTGEINYYNICKTLLELGFDGFVGFELIPSGAPEEAIGRIRESFFQP